MAAAISAASSVDSVVCVTSASRCGLRGLHLRHVGHVFHQVDAVVELAHGALHLGVALVADHDEFVALFGELGHLDVHLGHQRAGGVKHMKAALRGLLLHRLAHAVRAEHQRGAGRHVGQVFDEDRALGLEVVDDIGVVHDLVAHVDRAPEFLQCAFDDLDGAIDPRAKAPRLGQNDLHAPARSVVGVSAVNRALHTLGWAVGVRSGVVDATGHFKAPRSNALQTSPAGRPAGG